jgi:hypothetical protein
MSVSLKTSFWVAALLRRASVAGAYGALTRKGDMDAGAVLVKVATLDGLAVLYSPARSEQGERIWIPHGPLCERDIDAMIAKRAKTDPDLWVAEIEDKSGRHFLTETIDAPQ